MKRRALVRIRDLFRKKEHGMLLRLLIPIMIIVISQVAVFITVMLASGSMQYVYESSYKVLNERIYGRSSTISNQLDSRKVLISSHANKMNSIIGGLLLTEGKSASDIASDKEFSGAVINSIDREVSELAKSQGISGAFVVLDNANVGDPHAITYYRKTNSGITMLRGNIECADRIGAYYEGFDISDEMVLAPETAGQSNFFYKPINAAKDGYSDCGYWSMPFDFNRDGEEVMLYTEPLVSADGTVYGIIGIELSTSEIKDVLLYDTTGDEVLYLLTKSKAGNYSNEIAAKSSDLYSSQLGKFGMLEFTDNKVYEGILEVSTVNEQDDDEKLFGGMREISIYSESSPFAEEKWNVAAIVDNETLFGFSSILVKIAIYSIASAALFGVLGVLIAARMVTQPITSVVKAVNKLDPTKVVWFEKTNIKEIDTLTGSIKDLSERIAGSASKLSQILSVLDISIGAFEYDDTSEQAFCTEGFFDIMDWTEFTYTDGYVDKTFLEQKLAEMLSIDVNGNEYLYKITVKKDQTIRYIKLTMTELGTRTLGVVEDVTDETIQKHQIEFERDYDLLTGILNRRAFRREVSGLFESDVIDLRHAAIIMFDLDNLKYINDTYGHDYGDEYIRKSAESIRRFEKYNGMVARMSGDEFYVFISGYDSQDEIREVIEKVRRVFNSTDLIMSDETKMKLRASVGVAWYPEDSTDFEELLRFADFAMYTVKHSVKGDVNEFDAEKYGRDSILLSGKEELNRIIESELVRYALQPIIDAKTGMIFAYEALMRPQGETLKTPLDVIRVARQQAKMYKIEKLTWHKSIQAFITQVEKGLISPDARLFLNSFSSQILSDNDFEEYAQRYEKYLPNIVMEVLESDELNESFARRKSAYVKGWGGGIALDDFGTGYNGDYSLILLSPDYVKIDMAMVRGINEDENKQELIANLISYARRQKIKILAEGVQTKEEMRTLIRFGVDYMQGNYFALPAFEPEAINDEAKRSVIAANDESHS